MRENKQKGFDLNSKVKELSKKDEEIQKLLAENIQLQSKLENNEKTFVDVEICIPPPSGTPKIGGAND